MGTAIAALPACDGCGEKKTVVVVDDGGQRLRRPFDLNQHEGGIPRFQPRLLPIPDASAASPLPSARPIE